jgi:hypothetical protein
MKKLLYILGLGVILLGVLQMLTYSSSEPADNQSKQERFKEDYAIYSLPLPQSLSFAGEPVPIKDLQVRQSFDRELLVNTYWQSNMLLFLKRSGRYFPVIEPILMEHGIPEDFKYIPLIESGFTHVVSPAGAVSFWQFLEGTGRDYGMEINEAVDERYHLVKATHAACRYLKDAREELGSWTLAAASYNRGINGIQKQMERQQADDFYDLRLNPETARYLYRLLAIREIMSDPEGYGFHIKPQERYHPIPTRSLAVDTGIDNLGKWASKQGINYRILKFHNPWLRQAYLPEKAGKTYQVKIPREGHYALQETLMPKTNADLSPLDTTLSSNDSLAEPAR